MNGSFRYSPNVSDFRATIRAVLFKGTLRSHWVFVGIVVLVSAWSILGKSWWPIGLLGLWLGAYFLGVELGARKAYRKNVIGGKDVEVSFSDEALLMVTSTLRNETKWEYFSRLTDTGRLYILHNEARRIIAAIPKRVFPSPEIERSFLETARRGMARA
jgi:hypothetical protein